MDRARVVVEASSRGADIVEELLGECTGEQRTLVVRLFGAVWVELEERLHGADPEELIAELNEFAERQK